MNKLALLAPIFLLGFTFSPECRAQSGAPTAAASQQLFQDATALLKAGKVHEACAKFDESRKLEPQLGTLLNLASCHEREGKVATAWTEYSELADAAAKKGDAKRAAYAKKKIAELEPSLPRLSITVPEGTRELTLDGVVLGQAAWDTVLPIDPGDHVLAYTAPGKKPGNQHATATKGQTAKVVLPPLENDAVADVAPPVVPVTPPAATTPPPGAAASASPPTSTASAKGPEKSSRSTLQTTGYVLGAVGIAGLAVGGVFGAIALGDKGTVNNDCAGNRCTQSGLDAVDAARRDGTISTIGFIAGGACLAAGITMVVLGGKKTTQGGVAPYGAGLQAIGTF